jgi:hypothetical protein
VPVGCRCGIAGLKRSLRASVLQRAGAVPVGGGPLGGPPNDAASLTQQGQMLSGPGARLTGPADGTLAVSGDKGPERVGEVARAPLGVHAILVPLHAALAALAPATNSALSARLAPAKVHTMAHREGGRMCPSWHRHRQ